jgi:hypothetical protein
MTKAEGVFIFCLLLAVLGVYKYDWEPRQRALQHGQTLIEQRYDCWDRPAVWGDEDYDSRKAHCLQVEEELTKKG